MLGRAVITVATAVTAGITLTGCHFAHPPPGSTSGSTPRPVATTTSTTAAATATTRLADAPALLVQCAINTAGVRPVGQTWYQDGKVVINSTDAVSFDGWWRAHFTPGPYPQTFTIDGHKTHYLAFGATWIRKKGQWVPSHTAAADPKAQRTSLYAWSLWAAEHDGLPSAVCGTSASARQMQAQIYGSSTDNPWGT